MPVPKATNNNHATIESKESLYRTKWLMAHNRLHTLLHKSPASVTDEWGAYLKDLRFSETAAKIPA
jgi:hypothetical protein